MQPEAKTVSYMFGRISYLFKRIDIFFLDESGFIQTI